jgi:GrpB-like predicted nucleotidyltransferase (UPF0157 family)
MHAPNPARLVDHDPGWADAARAHLDGIREALRRLPGAEHADYQHIGSTAVPGLVAKPFVDLQVRILPLPDDGVLGPLLEPLGFRRELGSGPDSPGVFADIPRGSTRVDDDVWAKSLFVHRSEPVVVHVRRSDSPWGRYTVAFRDLLRADPSLRDRYAEVKQRLSAANVGKADYDGYTRAKTGFFDEVQARIEKHQA